MQNTSQDISNEQNIRAVTLATGALKDRGLDTISVPNALEQKIELIDATPWRDIPSRWQVRFAYPNSLDRSIAVTTNIKSGEIISVEEHRE